MWPKWWTVLWFGIPFVLIGASTGRWITALFVAGVWTIPLIVVMSQRSLKPPFDPHDEAHNTQVMYDRHRTGMDWLNED